MDQTPIPPADPVAGLAEELEILSSAAWRRRVLAGALQSPDSPACVLRDGRETWRVLERICAASGMGVDDVVKLVLSLLGEAW